MSNNKESCFLSTLRLIEKLQRNSESGKNCDNTCRKPFLGSTGNLICFNTRPITFYRCDNSLISVEYSDECGVMLNSSVFRVESINGNCVTCTILANNPNSTDFYDAYVSTNQTAIINLDCVCAIKCLADTVVKL